MGKKIKVAICINDFLIGGAQRMLVDMLGRLDRAQFQPVLITLFYWEGKEYFYDLLPADVPVHRLAFKGFWDFGSWIALFRTLRLLKPDIVLSNLFFSNTVTRMLKPLFRYKVAIVEHNTYVKKSKFHQHIDAWLSLFTSRIVAVSGTVADFTSRQEGIPRNTFVVIHNGINIARLRAEFAGADTTAVRKQLHISNESKIILNVARLTTQKNPRLLLEGFGDFALRRGEYVLLYVGGSAKWEAVLKEKAKALGVADRVFFAGMQKDVAPLYAIADVFVSTSDIEGFGIAHAEALACGIPVLTTKTAGPDEMIKEGKNGFFIGESTPAAVAKGLEKIVSADMQEMRERARESANAYGIEKTTAAYEKLFHEIARP